MLANLGAMNLLFVWSHDPTGAARTASLLRLTPQAKGSMLTAMMSVRTTSPTPGGRKIKAVSSLVHKLLKDLKQDFKAAALADASPQIFKCFAVSRLFNGGFIQNPVMCGSTEPREATQSH